MFELARDEMTATAERADALGGDELSDALCALVELESLLTSTRSSLIGVWESSLEWSVDGSSSPVAWLKRNTGVRGATASRQVKQARFLAKHALVADRLAAADITVDHVTSLARLDVPRLAEQFEADLDVLLRFAVELAADAFVVVCQQWLALADQEHDSAERGFGKRSLHLSQTLDGTWKLDAVLEADTGAILADLLDTISSEHAEIERAAVKVDPSLAFDTTPAQRRADAFADLVQRALGIDLDRSVGPKTAVTVIIDDDQLEAGCCATTDTGAAVPLETVTFLLCGAEITGLRLDQNCIKLNMGRIVRLATRAQRRALAARDKGCRFPGCDRSVHWCVAHHIIWWEHGGRTDLNNLILLCHHHHKLVHHGGWTIHADVLRGFTFTSPNGTSTHVSHRDRRRASRAHHQPARHLGNRQQRHRTRTQLSHTDPIERK